MQATKPKRQRRVRKSRLTPAEIRGINRRGLPIATIKKMPKSKKRNIPAKTWTTGASPADQVMKETGGHGKNVLSKAQREVQPEMLAASNQDLVHDIAPVITSSALLNCALGIVLTAKKRGWNSQNSPDDQYQTFGYIISIFKTSIEGGTLTFTAAPRWFVELCVALRPKRHSYLTSEAYYEPTVADSNPPLDPVLVMGTVEESYAVVFGTATGIPFNGFRSLVPSPAYDPEKGAAQFSSMWNVFPGKEVKGAPTELISPNSGPFFLERDCSAFAMVKARLATGYFNPGGVNNFLENEVHIDSPILAKFAGDNSIDDLVVNEFRAGFYYANGGGTSCYIGPRAMEFTDIDQYRNKGRAVFKIYNFDEFFNWFSLIIGGVLERAATQNAIQPKAYPLTSQQTQVMLRQALIPFFNNEMAQDLRMKEAYGPPSGILLMLPFSVGDNGCSQTALGAGPLVPRFFAEMVKGVRRITADVGVAQTGRSTMDWIPVLARSPIIDQLGNYTYANGESESLVYAVPPVDTEVPMNLIDCSVVDGSNTLYLNLNGTELTSMIAAHDEWMTYHQPFMTGLSKLTSSDGSPLFSSVVQTRIVRQKTPIPEVIVPVVGKTNQPSTLANAVKGLSRQPSLRQVKGYSVSSQRKLKQVRPIPGESDEFQAYCATTLNTNVPFVAELEKYRTLLISPTVTTNNENFSAGPGYLRALYGEGIDIPYSNSKDESALVNDAYNNPTLFTLHEQGAALDLKNVANSGKTEIEVLLDSLDAKGQGGFLSALSDILSVGGKVVGSVSKLTGF